MFKSFIFSIVYIFMVHSTIWFILILEKKNILSSKKFSTFKENLQSANIIHKLNSKKKKKKKKNIYNICKYLHI